MIDPTTPAARALLRWATDEAAYWDGVATDPEPLNSLLRKGAESRRDQLDAVVARLRTALPEVEREAVAIETRTAGGRPMIAPTDLPPRRQDHCTVADCGPRWNEPACIPSACPCPHHEAHECPVCGQDNDPSGPGAELMQEAIEGGAGVSEPTVRHQSGDDADGCIACWLDNDETGLEPENNLPCKEPTEDPDEPGVCWVCSHTVEPA